MVITRTDEQTRIHNARELIREARSLMMDSMALLDGLLPVDVGRPIDPPEPIPLGPAGKSPEVVGYAWMQGLFGFNIQPVSTFAAEYTWIGLRPPEERARVALSLQKDEWISSNRGLATARHVVRHWGRYLTGPAKFEPPKDFKTQRDEARAESAARVLRDFDAETALYVELAQDAQERARRMERRMVTRMSLERKL